MHKAYHIYVECMLTALVLQLRAAAAYCSSFARKVIWFWSRKSLLEFTIYLTSFCKTRLSNSLVEDMSFLASWFCNVFSSVGFQRLSHNFDVAEATFADAGNSSRHTPHDTSISKEPGRAVSRVGWVEANGLSTIVLIVVHSPGVATSYNNRPVTLFVALCKWQCIKSKYTFQNCPLVCK